jgi:hypothetical protein
MPPWRQARALEMSLTRLILQDSSLVLCPALRGLDTDRLIAELGHEDEP